MISLENVTRKFGSFTAVDDLSMSVPKGQVLGFLGPNGAGKTTTMRMISGFLSPTSARFPFAGMTLPNSPSKSRNASAICRKERRRMRI